MPDNPSKSIQRAKDLSYILSYLGFLLTIFGIILLFIPALPWVYYRVNAKATADEVTALTGFIGIWSDTPVLPTPSVTRPPKPVLTLPKFDSTLPDKNTLLIPKIGVRAVLQEGRDSERLLLHGVWRVPEFGTPFRNENPIIMAAHRFGYINWSSEFRKTNSFANLPRLSKGDIVSIIWEQRKFEYRVYEVSESTKLTDYEADLILYTCKYLKSPTRIIVYADRVK